MIRRIAFMAALAFSSGAFAQDAQPPRGNADAGKKIFTDVGCYTCHGTFGEGAAATGPRIADTDLPFDAFLGQLRHPASQMVPVPVTILTDAQAADIYAYLHTIKKVDWKTIPELQH